MSLIIALAIGIILGGTAGMFVMRGSPEYLIANVLAGIVGSVSGLAVYFFFLNPFNSDFTLFTLRGTACTGIGCLVVLVIFDGAHRLAPKATPYEDSDLDDE